MAQLFEAAPGNDLPQSPNYNVCPTNDVHVVTSADDARHLTSMRWGFLPRWYKTPTDGPLLINARSETISTKPAFRSSVRTRRCIIPATGFYEWTKATDGKRLPWYISRRNGEPLAFASIWRRWEAEGEALTTCAIVTTSAEGPVTDIHHRVPVVLEPDKWALWLGEERHGAAVLMKSPAEDVLDFHRVDPAVNSNRANGKELIQAI